MCNNISRKLQIYLKKVQNVQLIPSAARLRLKFSHNFGWCPNIKRFNQIMNFL